MPTTEQVKRLWRVSSLSNRAAPHILKYGALINVGKYLLDNDSFLRRSPSSVVLALGAAAILTTASSVHHGLIYGEPVRRAVYFWFHAGPIVAHYKFTKWWLDTTKAPVQKRHVIYKRLHDRYSVPSLKIILHLKGNDG